MKGWFAVILSSGALVGIVAYAAEWGALTSTVSDHIADANTHGNTEAIEQSVRELHNDVVEQKQDLKQFRSEQGAVNQKILQSLGGIERELQIERNNRR